MRLCVFDAGQGPRLGHVRRNHIVDLALLDPSLPRQRSVLAAMPQRLQAIADSCPLPAMLVRRDAVRILDEWDEPEPTSH